MNNNINSNANGLPKLVKKPLLQQVMKPKDWVYLVILIGVSAVCWTWVLSAYQQPINIDQIISDSATNTAIDKDV